MRSDPISDPDGIGGDLDFADVDLAVMCYLGIESPSQRPPYHAAPPPRIPIAAVLFRDADPQSDDTLSALFVGCTEAVPGFLSVQVDFDITLDKAGGPAFGTITLTEDTTSPFNCGNGTETLGSITMTPLDLDNDEDEDGCTDWYELGENPELGGLNDPFNPNDCDGLSGGAEELTADGLYEISHDFDDGYRRCMGAVETSPQLQMRVYCYTDSLIHEVNPQAPQYQDQYGDGLPGAPPPGPAVEPQCGDFTFDVNEIPPFQGIACDYVYGDVDGSHTVLTGFIVAGTHLYLYGCFEEDLLSEDPLEYEEDPLGNIFVIFFFNFKTGAGDSYLWPNQDIVACTANPPTPSGTADTGALQALKLATTEQMAACYTADPDCAFADNDPPFVDRTGDGVIDDQDKGDGAPDHRELDDDAACGRRDPFNINDFYDVSISQDGRRDGRIDLFTDINNVIANYAPFGYTAGDPAISGPGTMENYDRPVAMDGGHSWNYGSLDGKIDSFIDIVGVISQYLPFGCLPPE